jgi:cytochrome c-type biogenesis protein CcmH
MKIAKNTQMDGGKMTKRKVILILLFGLFGLLAVEISPAAAQEPGPTPSDDEINQVARDMYCPVCENIPLDVCPTQACSEWRALIALKLSEGWSDAEIKEYFAVQYGDRVLAEPPRRGLNWLVYILPPAFFGIGVVVLWRVMTTMKRRHTAETAANPPPPPPPADDPYLAEIEAELRKKE